MTSKKMNLEELKSLVKQGEGNYIEFKSSASRGAERDKIGQELCSFASTAGGTLLVGVDDDHKIIGIADAPRIQEQLVSKIYDRTEPPLAPEVEVIQLGDDRAVIRLSVEGNLDNVYTYGGVPYTRVGDETRRMGQDEYQRRVREHYPRSWETVPVEGAIEKDIDFKAVEEYIKRYNKWNRTELHLSVKELLLTRGCAVENSGGLQPTRAGILLFGKSPRKFFMKAYVTLARFPGLEIRDEILDVKDFSGPLMYVIDDAHSYLWERSMTMQRAATDRPTTETFRQYPKWPLRELIVNAVVHRDYAVAEGRVLIQMFADRIEFRSPGGFPAGVTAENALSAQRTRNPLIARMLHDLGYIEEFGGGLNRVFREMEEHPLGAPVPKIEEVARDVVVTLYSPEDFLPPEPKKEEKPELNPRQWKAVKYITEYRSITSPILAELTGVTDRTARRDLQDMVDKGVLTEIGEKKGRRYELL